MEAPPSPDSCNSVVGPSNKNKKPAARGGRAARPRGAARRAEHPRRDAAPREDWRSSALSTRRTIQSCLADMKRRGELERIREYSETLREGLFGNLYDRNNNNNNNASGDMRMPQLNLNPSIARTAPRNIFATNNLVPSALNPSIPPTAPTNIFATNNLVVPSDPKSIFIPNPPIADVREPWKPLLPPMSSFGWNTKPPANRFDAFPPLMQNPNRTGPRMAPSSEIRPSGCPAMPNDNTKPPVNRFDAFPALMQNPNQTAPRMAPSSGNSPSGSLAMPDDKTMDLLAPLQLNLLAVSLVAGFGGGHRRGDGGNEQGKEYLDLSLHL